MVKCISAKCAFVAVAFLFGCAPTMRNFAFDETNSLSGKRIGVFYD